MKTRLLISFLIVSTTILIGGVNLLKITGHSQNGNVVIEWQTISETNLDRFVVEKKAYNNGTFVELGTVLPNSSRTYEYVDQSVFKTSDQLYIYRVKIVDTDGTVSYSGEIAVPHSNVSGVVKRTWGSIKALFR
jgi:hypothetical protein